MADGIIIRITGFLIKEDLVEDLEEDTEEDSGLIEIGASLSFWAIILELFILRLEVIDSMDIGAMGDGIDLIREDGTHLIPGVGMSETIKDKLL